MQATVALRPSAVAQLRGLIRANRVSCRGLEHAADTVANEGIAATFRFFARQRGESAAELERHVGRIDPTPGEREGAAEVAAGLGLLEGVRGSRGGGDDEAVLIEAERAEEEIQRRYESVLRETVGQEVHEVVLRQYREMQVGYDLVRNMRGSE